MNDPVDKIVTIILGGGKGSRLYPLTKERCKPAVPLGGKYRLIDIPISNSINSELRKIYVATQFMSSSLNNHVVNSYMMDTFSGGFVSIVAAMQIKGGGDDWFQGTADAIRKSLGIINLKQYKKALILSGDQLYKMDYRSLIEMHEEKNADVTLSVLPVTSSRALDLGILKIDSDSKIDQFVEKPNDPKILESLKVSEQFANNNGLQDSNKKWLASMGIYLFETKLLLELLKDKDNVDFGRDIIPKVIKTHNVYTYLFNDYWEDIGTIKSFYEANIALGKRNPPFHFYSKDSDKIFTRQRFLMATRILGATISESIISDGCEISEGAVINSSIIGIRAKIGENSTISSSIVMGADALYHPESDESHQQIKVGDNVTIEKAIIDKNVLIGNNTKIINKDRKENFDGENYYIRDNIVIIPKNTVIPPNQII
ncbi:MAG: glucose-1-phosphate adenylyltransferase [Nitrospinota bacterium]